MRIQEFSPSRGGGGGGGTGYREGIGGPGKITISIGPGPPDSKKLGQRFLLFLLFISPHLQLL